MKAVLSTLKFIVVFLFVSLLSNCAHSPKGFNPIHGFTPQANSQLEAFFKKTKAETGRKVAVFDGDGTVLGQTPHYLADECMYMYAKKKPEKKPELLVEMGKIRNVSMRYVQGRVEYLAGESVTFLRDMGEKCFNQHYSKKIFEPSRRLIQVLKQHGFEVWVVTGSPQVLYQQFLAKQLDIPIINVVGVKSVVRGGIVTGEMVPPIPQDHGKKEAIETFIQEQPLFVAGNSRGDKEMIEYSRGLRMIVNPDEHVAPDQKQSIADYAKSENWLIVRIRDVPEPGFPSISSKAFGIRINKTRDVKSD
ncbi:MAG: haloacid dehalogenase-like hydrolase [Deltaproteobacteria bacterium]|nr:haloacid dehalogenase-like hydrolase [Deltaproteobacteria bacterium]